MWNRERSRYECDICGEPAVVLDPTKEGMKAYCVRHITYISGLQDDEQQNAPRPQVRNRIGRRG